MPRNGRMLRSVGAPAGASPGDMRFSFIEGKMHSARFIEFLKKLRHDAGRPIIVVTDTARHHHNRETRAFVATQAGSILMAFLPRLLTRSQSR